MTLIANFVQLFTTYYPIVMGIVWLTGSYISGILMKQKRDLSFKENPKVSVLLSMFNEEDTIEEALNSFGSIQYDNYEIVIVDDKSKDDSVRVVQEWAAQHQDEVALKLIALPVNKGKASALNEAVLQIDSEYILVTDADSLLHEDAITNLLRHFTDENVGAVTGKPVVRNRTTLLGRLQTLEYVGVIDSIKRAQDTLYDGIMTVSGVVVMYRKQALESVGWFDMQAITEDIDVTWRLRKRGWGVQYQPEALSYILVPETLKGYVKQRTRWAIGSIEVLFKNIHWVARLGTMRQKLLLFDIILGHIWAVFAIIAFVQYMVVIITTQTFALSGVVILLYNTIFFLMLILGIVHDKGDSKLNWLDVVSLPFYSAFYWLTAVYTAILSEINVAFFHKNEGTWDSPDRGK